ncbi:hypothetical protein L4G92_09340 [Neisseria sp. ZJ106]|uniref:Uncharacterized protein n=1 Tax=Neisseria lisongii TaxID=2912188 RepID=A0ABY7RJR6_9NEIS|nr:hypothetical protein [Neisseria lisongii]MCF7522229.1 hypothetical protein [Neisseria lisongii]WCL71869.1 hypothetical protein PJU73_01730 [Neisseria lisongii]
MNPICKLMSAALCGMMLSGGIYAQPSAKTAQTKPYNDNPYNEEITVSEWKTKISNAHDPVVNKAGSIWLLDKDNWDKVKKDPEIGARQVALFEAIRYMELWNEAVENPSMLPSSKNMRVAFCQFGKDHGIVDVDVYKMTLSDLQKQRKDWSKCDKNFQPTVQNIKKGLNKDKRLDPRLEQNKAKYIKPLP